MGMMEVTIIILCFIVFIGVINERFLHVQSDIALLLFTLCISVVLMAVDRLGDGIPFVRELGDFGFESYLLDCVLCFMLFAGASKVNMGKMKQNIKGISLLALVTTVVSSAFYGLLFYLMAQLFLGGISIWICIMLGCIVSPTDPIAATGILNKLGLSKNVTSVIENESLFNDGTGVALFVFIKSIICESGESNFLVVMAKEIFGAFFVALVISFILFEFLKLTNDPVKHLLISILDVSLVYMICEHFGFSGVIASVICGMFFAYRMNGIERKRMVVDPHDLYHIFWEVVDTILNAVLFVMIGVSVLDVTFSPYIFALIPISIVCVVISRYAGVGLSSIFIGRSIPSSYSLSEFVLLMTWSALKGGLSLALAMSTKEFLPEDIYHIVMNVTYITIFFTVIVQGLTIKMGYKKIEKHKAIRLQNKGRRIER